MVPLHLATLMSVSKISPSDDCSLIVCMFVEFSELKFKGRHFLLSCCFDEKIFCLRKTTEMTLNSVHFEPSTCVLVSVGVKSKDLMVFRSTKLPSSLPQKKKSFSMKSGTRSDFFSASLRGTGKRFASLQKF